MLKPEAGEEVAVLTVVDPSYRSVNRSVNRPHSPTRQKNVSHNSKRKTKINVDNRKVYVDNSKRNINIDNSKHVDVDIDRHGGHYHGGYYGHGGGFVVGLAAGIVIGAIVTSPPRGYW